MEQYHEADHQDTSYVDWSFLPPTALHVIGTVLPPSSLLRARLVNRHWAGCLAALVDTLYIVPEYFLTEQSVAEVQKAFPKATTVSLDLQDTFMAVPLAYKDSLDRYISLRNEHVAAADATIEEASTASSDVCQTDGAADSGRPSEDASGGAMGTAESAPERPASPADADVTGIEPSSQASTSTPHTSGTAAPNLGSSTPSSSSAPQPFQPQQQQSVAALAAAFAADFLNGAHNCRTGSAGCSASPAEPPGPPAPAQAAEGGGDAGHGQADPPAAAPATGGRIEAAVAAATGAVDPPVAVAADLAGAAAVPALVPVVGQLPAIPGAQPPSSPPTFPYSAIPVEPLTGLVPPAATHLRVRLPDSLDVQAHHADVSTSWDYVSALLARVGSSLSSLSLSTAPDAAHISMLSPLTQLTSLIMDEASHSTWSVEHLPIVGSLTGLRNLAIKIPPFRSSRPDPPTTPQPPAALASWTALQRLTKLHVSALRYSFHSSLVAVLPHLNNLEYLALRAPQTRLPWMGTEKPLFANIGTLTGLTQLSLALGDHNMAPQDWQSLTTLTKLSAIELSVSEGSDGLNVPTGLEFPALKSLKLRYPNSQDLVRIAVWSGIQRLDIKFPEHEREWHQEDAVVELLDFRTKLLPTAGAAVICSVLDNAPAAHLAASGALDAGFSLGPAGVVALMGQLAPLHQQQQQSGAGGGPGGGRHGNASMPPTGAGNTAGLTSWWSPLLPLLALPNMVDFRCSAKEGLASHDPILFDEIISGLCAAWPGVTRLCFKGCINVLSQQGGWDSLKQLTRLQQLELRHHPPQEGEPPADHNISRAQRARFLRVEPIKLPATSLPDSLQTLLLENVELRRKETYCLTNLTSLERRTTCRHFPEFVGMPLQRLVVSNCCVKAKGIASIALECGRLTHLVFAVYKVSEEADLRELQDIFHDILYPKAMRLTQLQVLKVRVLAGCITQALVQDMVQHLPHLQRLKLTSSDGWSDPALFLPLTRMSGLRKCSLAYFKSAELAMLLRAEFRTALPYCKIKAKHETG
ncbi:hypothetical protein VOLCADRAFT_99466 [Volvox carteri f. nagariensis]|uniref:F-box domain-containing protein n=1 Tax=Volvox carteri f. nagariensis TaxID=3068 RepID=D8UHV5_VOLCA|nr:uncharacterized protein VOLCADRAFT_99466 [Volvox carteri f. nagariensis]EFJ40685.1 hypothetical protein VOLCADRAFT_99466 [Volvox carteri f. nagariensis]|eukprot:XP_002958231.1 hypothetical protein VOLCADRAFT_99466 [Volvox carteri f. nagariensis]